MEQQFEILRHTRNNVLAIINGLTLEQLNTVPTGFRNNIIWNAAHMVVTQQLLCYKLTGLKMLIADDIVDRYKKGSEVISPVGQEEVDFIKEMMVTLRKRLIQDYNSNNFTNFSNYTSSYGVVLDNIDDAIQFNNVHEGLHLGYIMAIKKLVI